MTKQDPPKRPVVLRQAWLLTEPGAPPAEHGYTYHLTEADRAAFVSAELRRASPCAAAPEPIGEPELVHVTEEQLRQIREALHGLRVG